MPHNVEIDYLDGEFTVQEEAPATVAELVSQLGEEMVVEETTSNLRYRNKHPRVYRKVSAAVEASGFAREVKETKENKDGTKKEIKEGEIQHLRRYLATAGDDPSVRETLQNLFSTTASSEPLYVKGERTGGGGKIAQKDMEVANSLFTKGTEKVEEVVEKIEARVPGYKVSRDADEAVTPESLARGISAFNKQLQKEQREQLLGV